MKGQAEYLRSCLLAGSLDPENESCGLEMKFSAKYDIQLEKYTPNQKVQNLIKILFGNYPKRFWKNTGFAGCHKI
ncbi:MAG: hypothetical protein SRB2_02911 [Desulfobacteraceae bacterium Eth-SRB2]|nr:MAG: hypothetical protein SRB2_02911 [Desulfobacteraceae bacterium Eth-SRB2]